MRTSWESRLRITPSQMVHDWMAGMSVREVDVRWPNSASCWRGDHGFC